MSERRYKEAVVYSVEVDSFQDSNGDREATMHPSASTSNRNGVNGIRCCAGSRS